MKTNSSKSKLNLKKLQITKITNLNTIQGGKEINTIDRSYRPDCPTEDCPSNNNLC